MIADNEEQSHVFQAACKVDSAMKDILQEGGSSITAEKAAVLAALQFSSTVLKSETHTQHILQKMMLLIEKIDRELLGLDSF